MFTTDESGPIPTDDLSDVVDWVTNRLLTSRATIASMLSDDTTGGTSVDSRLSAVVAELDRTVADLRRAAQANVGVQPAGRNAKAVARARPRTSHRVAGFGRPLGDDDES